jgi:hypothetical protein
MRGTGRGRAGEPSTQASLLPPPCCIDTMRMSASEATRTSPPGSTRNPSAPAAANTRSPMLRATSARASRAGALFPAPPASSASTGACERLTISCATKSKGRSAIRAASASSSATGRSPQNTGRAPRVG